MEYIINIILYIIIATIIFVLIYRNLLGETIVDNTDIPYQKLSSNDELDKKHIQVSKTKTKITKPKSILKKPNKKKSATTRKNPDMVFIDIEDSGEYIGKIVIKLFIDVVPKTCKNFYYLCKNGSYKNSPLHRIIKDFMIQGGDYTNGDGTGGRSIYGNKFDDENFDIPHDRPYLLSMANSGPNTNGSQFFITTSETPHLDGKHVVFGIVVKGHDIVDYLNNVKTNMGDRPSGDIVISECGLHK